MKVLNSLGLMSIRNDHFWKISINQVCNWKIWIALTNDQRALNSIILQIYSRILWFTNDCLYKKFLKSLTLTHFSPPDLNADCSVSS